MGMLQEIRSIIDRIVLLYWDMQLIQELLSNLIHTIIFVSTEPTIIGLMSIVIVFTQKKSTIPVLYSYNKILKLFFIIWIYST